MESLNCFESYAISGFTRGLQCKLYDENLLDVGISVPHPRAVLTNITDDS